MIYRFADFEIDTQNYRLTRQGNVVEVEPKVFDLLSHLIVNRDRLVTRNELFENLWPGRVVSDSSLDNQIKTARKLLGDSGRTQSIIETIRGRGFRFVAQTEEKVEQATRDRRSNAIFPELPGKPSIAVLPFANLGDDPEQAYFSDGVSDDITTALTYFSGLFVVARNSAFAYRNRSPGARQVASELGVRFLLEGSVRRSGNRIRINSQLVDALADTQVWAERFDGESRDIFALQDDITRKIVGSIGSQIELSEVKRLRGMPATSLSSYELALRAKSGVFEAELNGDAAQLESAIDIARRALDQDADNTGALWILGLGEFVRYLYNWDENPGAALERAMSSAERLVLADSANADGFGLRGILRIFRRQYDMALADFARAISLNQNSALNLFFAAWGESAAGETEKAKQHAHLGLRLSPREREIWLGLAYLALCQAGFAERDFEQSMHWGRLSIQMHSRAPVRRALMVACCAHGDQLDEATRHAGELEGFAPAFVSSLLRGDVQLYKMPDHNQLVIEGLRKAGMVRAPG